MEKQIQITDHCAEQLAQLADVRGITESALIEEGLDMLFREHARQDMSANALQADWELLRQWEAEFGSLEKRPATLKIDPDEIVSSIGTPVDATKIRRIGDLP